MNTKIKDTFGERIFSVCNTVFLTLVTLCFLLPFWVVVVTSFVGESESARRGNFILFPEQFDFSAYQMLLSSGSTIYNGYKITAFVVIVGTLLSLLVTAMLAYGLSKRTIPGNKGFTMFIFITMLFNGGLIPTFLLNKSLGLMDNVWVLILPSLVSAWNTFILRNFFYQIPQSLEEAAEIDGATPMQILFRVVVPLSKPALFTIGLFYAVGYWNAWFNAAIYINDTAKIPIQNIMRNIVLNNDVADVNTAVQNAMVHKPLAAAVRSAVIIVSTLPIICIYPFIQKYFEKGVLIGSVKS